MVPSNVYDVNSGETQSKANIVEQPTEQTSTTTSIMEIPVTDSVTVEEETEYVDLKQPVIEDPSAEIIQNDEIQLLPSTTSQRITDTVIDLPVFTPRFLSKFELLLSESEVNTFNSMFAAGKKSENVIYNAWEMMKIATLPIEEKQALTEILASNTPKNIKKRAKRSSGKTPEGVARYLPTSKEHMEILVDRNKEKKEERGPTQGKTERSSQL